MRGDDGGRRFSAAGRAKLSTSGSTSAPAPSTPTPYPPKARLPSLSSTASCVSIETPAGAMAQPVAPLSRKISPSTVGRLARATDPPAEDPFDACLGHSIPSEQPKEVGAPGSYVRPPQGQSTPMGGRASSVSRGELGPNWRCAGYLAPIRVGAVYLSGPG